MMAHRLAALLLLAIWLTPAGAQEQVAVPALQARVTDLTGTLSAQQRQTLEQALAQFEQRKGVQIAVLLVPTTGEETIEQYSIRVVDQWRLGRKGVDDGVLLLVARDDRELRIEVGYGLEGVVPDAQANRVVEDVIVPYFRQGDYYAGISAGLARLMGLIEGEALPPPVSRAPSGQGQPGGGGLLPMILFGFVFLSGIMGRLLGRLPGALVTGGVIGGLLWLLAGSLLLGLVAGAVSFVLALAGVAPLVLRGGYYGGRGGGGFGGGGFGGGGGGFGGGGASGRW